jgi:hypothetical protein
MIDVILRNTESQRKLLTREKQLVIHFMAFTVREYPHDNVGWMFGLPSFKILDIGERFREIHAGVVQSQSTQKLQHF